jgi:hypothetical protein
MFEITNQIEKIAIGVSILIIILAMQQCFLLDKKQPHIKGARHLQQ